MKLSPEEIDKAIKEKEKHWASLTEEEKRKDKLLHPCQNQQRTVAAQPSGNRVVFPVCIFAAVWYPGSFQEIPSDRKQLFYKSLKQ